MTIKERPILMCAEVVRAILDGRKSQTRRIVKDLTWIADTAEVVKPYWRIDHTYGSYGWDSQNPDHVKDLMRLCPYGFAGDRLWVRETFAMEPKSHAGDRVLFRADGDQLIWSWRPSIHMPRWASRLTLEIVNVRVERLQDITKDDARAEGIEWVSTDRCLSFKNYEFRTAHPSRRTIPNDQQHRIVGYESPCASYKSLWDSINAKRGFGWDTNPYVWAIEFKKV